MTRLTIIRMAAPPVSDSATELAQGKAMSRAPICSGMT